MVSNNILGCVLGGCNCIKMLGHHRHFSQNTNFKAASFWFMFQKQSAVSSFSIELQSEDYRLTAYIK